MYPHLSAYQIFAEGSKPSASRIKRTKGAQDRTLTSKFVQTSPFSGLPNRIASGLKPLARLVMRGALQ
ncbi:MAG: hypothetical protein CUN52_01105 [Phototrophicales bacterium]|nr:MAG: hypothetical protein CUN52_01105 [Phototrophicales bacterium]